MVLLLLIVAAGAVLLGVGSIAAGARRRPDEVERFHRARGITSGWAYGAGEHARPDA
jgi:hypothetical protein